MLMFKHAVIYGGKYYPPNTPIAEEPAQKAAEADESVDVISAEEESEVTVKPAQKAAKSRKKASGDAE